jgi:hypothetical protein
MLKIPQERLDTWLQRSCADRIIQLLLITLQLESWLLNACMAVDLMSVNLEKKLGTTFSQNKFKLKKEKCLEVGQLKPPISLTK